MDKPINVQEIETNNWQKQRNTIGGIVTEDEDIEQCMSTILETIKGECPLQPNIGSNFIEAIGENLQDAEQIIKTIIFKEFPIQEPRAKIIKVTSQYIDDFKLYITVEWQNIRTKDIKVSNFKI